MTESSGCTSLVHSVSCKPLSSFSTRGIAVLVAAYTLRLQQKMKMWVQKSETPSRCSSFCRCNIEEKGSFSLVGHFLCCNDASRLCMSRCWKFFRFCTEHRAPSEWVAAANVIFSSLSLLLPATLVWCLSGGLDD